MPEEHVDRHALAAPGGENAALAVGVGQRQQDALGQVVDVDRRDEALAAAGDAQRAGPQALDDPDGPRHRAGPVTSPGRTIVAPRLRATSSDAPFVST